MFLSQGVHYQRFYCTQIHSKLSTFQYIVFQTLFFFLSKLCSLLIANTDIIFLADIAYNQHLTLLLVQHYAHSGNQALVISVAVFHPQECGYTSLGLLK